MTKKSESRAGFGPGEATRRVPIISISRNAGAAELLVLAVMPGQFWTTAQVPLSKALKPNELPHPGQHVYSDTSLSDCSCLYCILYVCVCVLTDSEKH